MPIYRDKKSGCWMFDFDRRIEGQRIRRRQLLPASTNRYAHLHDEAMAAAINSIGSKKAG